MLYRIKVFYRFLVVFGMGYACMVYLSLGLTEIFHLNLDKPEAIYLAAFISIFVLCIFRDCWFLHPIIIATDHFINRIICPFLYCDTDGRLCIKVYVNLWHGSTRGLV